MKSIPWRLAIVAMMALAGCDSSSTDLESPQTSTMQLRFGMTPQVGDSVPDIVGVDTDGVEFRLSDYKGKVIMLDFWGDW